MSAKGEILPFCFFFDRSASDSSPKGINIYGTGHSVQLAPKPITGFIDGVHSMPVQLVQDMDEKVYPMFGNRCSELGDYSFSTRFFQEH